MIIRSKRRTMVLCMRLDIAPPWVGLLPGRGPCPRHHRCQHDHGDATGLLLTKPPKRSNSLISRAWSEKAFFVSSCWSESPLTVDYSCAEFQIRIPAVQILGTQPVAQFRASCGEWLVEGVNGSTT